MRILQNFKECANEKPCHKECDSTESPKHRNQND